METIEQKVKDYILAEFLPGEDPDNLALDTQLISSGILDSIATLKLATFLEEELGAALEPHELDADNLGTITLIANLVRSKQ